jgi:hypothetical protein
MDPLTIITAAGTIISLIIPPVFDFIRKKFLPSADTPESTMGTLAVSKPEALAPYTEALAKYLDAETRYFNRDVSGSPSLWVVNLRASIRPLCVVGSLILLCLDTIEWFRVDPSIRAGCFLIIGNWLGSRIT